MGLRTLYTQTRLSWGSILSLLLAGSSYVGAIELDLDDQASIKKAAATVAFDMMKYYTGNQTGDTPGNLPDPYYWWECGAMFGAMVDYWYLTGDPSYNEATTQALLAQIGPDRNYMPPNQTSTLGNDDQAFWGMSAMSAAENNYPDPPKDQPQWLALAQAVFNSQVPRWDDKTCGGGLRWQIFSFNAGFDYKNSISNGAFFNLGARLARYTGNQTYADWAEKTYDWMVKTNLINTQTYAVIDGSHDLDGGCKTGNDLQWSYNVGILLHGAAHMYNYTKGSDVWRERVQGLLGATDTFFDKNQKDVAVEVACEGVGTCNNDQRSFKAYLFRWLGSITKLAPFTTETAMRKIRGSAKAAALQCSGGNKKTTCGQKWTQGAAFDGTTGVGEQMSALEVIQANLQPFKDKGPAADGKGGTSKGDPSAGTVPSTWSGKPPEAEITGADRAGAGVLTALMILLISSGSIWIVLGM